MEAVSQNGIQFVNAVAVRKDLPGGGWIELKSELSAGERRRMETAGMGKVSAVISAGHEQNELAIDWDRVNMARVEAYLVGWSATTPDGKPVQITRDALDALAQASFDAINEIVQAHHRECEAKKKRTIASTTTPASPS